jgi:hypothetical protein
MQHIKEGLLIHHRIQSGIGWVVGDFWAINPNFQQLSAINTLPWLCRGFHESLSPIDDGEWFVEGGEVEERSHDRY